MPKWIIATAMTERWKRAKRGTGRRRRESGRTAKDYHHGHHHRQEEGKEGNSDAGKISCNVLYFVSRAGTGAKKTQIIYCLNRSGKKKASLTFAHRIRYHRWHKYCH